tara:strand:- start:783 stop:1448 length:666 start_codon:yes stop_codon:yes gene_type:complete
MQPRRWEGEDVTGWYISPKVDGVRARWNGSEFISRGGKVLEAGGFDLPETTLDGELSAGSLALTLSALGADGDKSTLQFHPFDAPDVPGPFSERLGSVPRHDQTVCRDMDHFGDMVEKALLDGFEGVVCHHPTNLYASGASPRLLKQKPFRDSEARCVGITSTGRPSLVCDWNGVEIKIPNIPAKISANPPVGELVTFSFQETTAKGLPRHPIFDAVRNYE